MKEIKEILSVNNNYVKELCKLNDIKYRKEKGSFLVEGYHLVEEAKNANLLKEVLIVDEKDYIEGVNNIKVTYDIIKKITNTINPQNIVGIVKMIEYSNLDFGKLVVALDRIKDPGNLGTIIRSSLAMYASSVILSNDSVDLYNDKVVRSTQGAMFNIPIIKCDMLSKLKELKEKGYKVIGTVVMQDSLDIEDIGIQDKIVLLIGNEATGISTDLLDLCDYKVTIKMNNKMESLNAGVATSIALYSLNKKVK